MSVARILIIAGSDSGGGAGIQADIKTVTMLGGHAMTAITAITAQNTLGVQAVHPIPTDMVIAQMKSVIDDIGVDAVKIGMIGSAETAEAVADFLTSSFPRKRESISDTIDQVQGLEMDSRFRGNDGGVLDVPIVLDPVMVATSGSTLADADTIAAFDKLMRIATLVTPNIPELSVLSGMDAMSMNAMEAAALALKDRYGCAVLAKGGHQPIVKENGMKLVRDLLIKSDSITAYTNSWIDTRHAHGTGCTLASGVAAGLGAGLSLDGAVDRAEAFVSAALRAAPGLGGGHGPMGHALGVTPFYHLLAAFDANGWDAKAFAARYSDDA